MFLWEVSALQQSNAAVNALYERLRPSLAILGDERRPTGAAALVDSQKGLYLAHVDAVQGDTVQARVGEWRVSLKVEGDDPRTGLVVLSLRSATPAGVGPALTIADLEPSSGAKVCILLADRGLPATFIGGKQIMLTADQKYALPSSEIRFEGSPNLVGGSLVVSFDGKLLGAMGATVAQPGRSSSISLKILGDVRRGLAGGGSMLPQNFRPGSLTVAYSPTLVLFKRSVAGLAADNHRPDYAALGFKVADAPGGGAIIKYISPDTPASRSGVKVNDVLLAIGDHPIERHYDFIQALLNYRPGDKAMLRIRHDGTESSVEVTFAKSRT